MSEVIAATPAASPSPMQRVRTWIGILGGYFTAQTLTQLLGIAAGVLFIRYMPVGEFALYTLATSMLTFFAFTTDLGSTGSLVHFYRRAARDGEDFALYLAAVLSLRRRAYLAGAMVILVALPLTAFARGFPVRGVALATAAVLLAVALQISASVRLLALRLHDRFAQSYRAEVAGAALRLVLALAMVGAALLRSWLALLVAAAGSVTTAWLARGPAEGATLRGHDGQTVDLRPYRRAILRYLLPTLPSALYFAVQAPLVVWLAATFGASRTIAEVGALTRLGLLVGIFGGLTGVVFLPRLARIPEERLWRWRALQFGGLLAAVAATLLAAAWLAPAQLLWILGEQYQGLHRELLLVVATAACGLVGGYVVNLNLSRSWTRLQPLTLAVEVLCLVGLIAWLPLDSTSGVLRLGLLAVTAGVAMQLAVALLGVTRPRLVAWHP